MGSNPRYGQLQIGLYMVILRDALERIRLIKNNSNRTATKRKRSHDMGNDDSEPVSKKLRSRSLRSKLQKSTEDIQSVSLFHAIYRQYGDNVTDRAQ